jgi:CRP/FNR family transcriptional regulator
MKNLQTTTGACFESIGTFAPNLSAYQLAHLTSNSKVIELNKKDFFMRAGKVQKYLGFLTRGLARAYFIDEDGNETTVCFFSEGDFVADYPAFINQRPSRYIIQCLEPSTFICIAFDDITLVYNRSATATDYRSLIAEELLNQQQIRLESFIFKRAEQRYLDFIKQYPNVFRRISLSHLCSYLGIERQTLTRIRQRLAHR